MSKNLLFKREAGVSEGLAALQRMIGVLDRLEEVAEKGDVKFVKAAAERADSELNTSSPRGGLDWVAGWSMVEYPAFATKLHNEMSCVAQWVHAGKDQGHALEYWQSVLPKLKELLRSWRIATVYIGEKEARQVTSANLQRVVQNGMETFNNEIAAISYEMKKRGEIQTEVKRMTDILTTIMKKQDALGAGQGVVVGLLGDLKNLILKPPRPKRARGPKIAPQTPSPPVSSWAVRLARLFGRR